MGFKNISLMLITPAPNERFLASNRRGTEKETDCVLLLALVASSNSGTSAMITSWTSFQVSNASHVLR